MVASAQIAMKTVIAHEGTGWVQNDAGRGPCAYGVLLADNRTEIAAAIGIPASQLTPAVFRDAFDSGRFNADDAAAIGASKYATKFNGIDDQHTMTHVVDISFNSGPGRAAIMIQQVTNAVIAENGLDPSLRVNVNGSIGREEMEKINQVVAEVGSAAFNDRLAETRLSFYNSLVHGNPDKFGRYQGGWTKRAMSFHSEGDAAQIVHSGATASTYDPVVEEQIKRAQDAGITDFEKQMAKLQEMGGFGELIGFVLMLMQAVKDSQGKEAPSPEIRKAAVDAAKGIAQSGGTTGDENAPRNAGITSDDLDKFNSLNV